MSKRTLAALLSAIGFWLGPSFEVAGGSGAITYSPDKYFEDSLQARAEAKRKLMSFSVRYLKLAQDCPLVSTNIELGDEANAEKKERLRLCVEQNRSLALEINKSNEYVLRASIEVYSGVAEVEGYCGRKEHANKIQLAVAQILDSTPSLRKHGDPKTGERVFDDLRSGILDVDCNAIEAMHKTIAASAERDARKLHGVKGAQ